MATVVIHGVYRDLSDQIAEVEFDPSECDWTEALLDSDYPELCYVPWERWNKKGEFRSHRDGHLTHVAEVTL